MWVSEGFINMDRIDSLRYIVAANISMATSSIGIMQHGSSTTWNGMKLHT